MERGLNLKAYCPADTTLTPQPAARQRKPRPKSDLGAGGTLVECLREVIWRVRLGNAARAAGFPLGLLGCCSHLAQNGTVAFDVGIVL